MRTPFDPTDHLLQSLADEAADLPRRAAAEARQTRTLRAKQRRQFGLTLAVLLASVGVWQIFPRVERGAESFAMKSLPVAIVTLPEQPASTTPEPRGYVIVRTEEQARNEPLPIPEGLSKEQRAVVEAARGLPLVLVRDSSGKVARIHVIER